MPARRPVSLLAAVWLAGVGLATGTGVVAVQLVAKQVGDPSVTVLSAADVKGKLASTPPTASPNRGPGSTTRGTSKPTAIATPTHESGEDSGTSKGTSGPAAASRQGSSSSKGSTPTGTQQSRGSDDAPSTAPATGSSTTSTTSDVKAFDSQGGSVGVRCRGTKPEQVYASPAQGYRLDESSVSGSTLEVRFESSTTDVRIKVGCSTGSPVLIERRADDRNDESDGSGGSTGSHSDGSVDGAGEK